MRAILWVIGFWGSLSCLWWIYLAQKAIRFRHRCVWLHELPPEQKKISPAFWPTVSVIVPIRDEEVILERCLSTLLKLDYPSYEVIAVDDRSSDNSGTILDRMAQTYSHLKVIHIKELPEGWVGKCHALDCGGRKAKGDYILFTDSDGVWDPSVLKRTVSYMEVEGLDHTSMLCRIILNNIWEKSFILAFYNLLFSLGPIWKVEDPESPINIGVALFQLFKREIFEKIEGMTKMRLSITDDFALASAIKAHGYKCRLILNENLLIRRWQEGLMGHILGLDKNFFAVAGFNYFISFVFLFFNFSLNLSPFATLTMGFYFRSLSLISLGAAALISIWTITLLYHRQVTRRPIDLFFIPIGSFFLGASLVWSVCCYFRQKGGAWRDTFYSLKDLRLHYAERNQWLSRSWANRNQRLIETEQKTSSVIRKSS